MSKTLDTLIKLHKRNLDEKRKELVKEEKFRDEVTEILDTHKTEMKTESAEAAKSLTSGYIFDKYYDRALRKEEKINTVLQQQDVKIAELSDDILSEFSELKKHEILKDIKNKQEEAKLNKKEQEFLDEVALNSFIQSRNDQ